MEIKGVKIDYLGHDGFLIREGIHSLAVDPLNVSENVGPVDVILITHSHYDHCSIKDIAKLSKKGTIILIPADAQSKITHINDVEMQIVEVGDEIAFKNIKISTVPAYNIGKVFHGKSEGWLGYVIKFDGLVIYHAGDSDRIPEMEKLTGYGKQGNEFVVMLPVSGKFVMNAEEAADVAALLSPTLAIPMHYGAGVVGTLEDAQRFVSLCSERKIHAEILEKL